MSGYHKLIIKKFRNVKVFNNESRSNFFLNQKFTNLTSDFKHNWAPDR